ncbi:hypothetical protein [Epilithonimonas vandammei]|uniref:Uncharacterized protein n=1 Tax=Epilithonimonas vandammei TaxID=2487072 RepID=A0A3G8YEP7_9FLAO|nr:hypothetical protein [Epilithonimonas vandammei]AZI39741.1 hypothetical protein EIB74_07110 [Epilithonimonas vandammei]
MAKKEILTDLWVYELLKEANVDLHPQGSNIKDIDNALKSASKAGTGKDFTRIYMAFEMEISSKTYSDLEILR